jgi:hypothetical protein
MKYMLLMYADESKAPHSPEEYHANVERDGIPPF